MAQVCQASSLLCEWINFVSHDANHNLEKALLYISLYKQTYLANFIQLFNAVVCMAFLK